MIQLLLLISRAMLWTGNSYLVQILHLASTSRLRHMCMLVIFLWTEFQDMSSWIRVLLSQGCLSASALILLASTLQSVFFLPLSLTSHFWRSIYFSKLVIANSFSATLGCKSFSQPLASFTTQHCLFQGLGSQLFETEASWKEHPYLPASERGRELWMPI